MGEGSPGEQKAEAEREATGQGVEGHGSRGGRSQVKGWEALAAFATLGSRSQGSA